MNVMWKGSLWRVVIVVLCVCLGACGKSKKEIAADAERQRVAVEAAAVAASVAASAAAERQAADERARAEVAQLASLKSKASSHLKDPASAQFQDLRLNTPKTALCGKLNAKNGFGGYVGFREFVVSDAEFIVKPEECGKVPTAQIDKPEDASACMQFLLAIVEKKICD